MTVASTTNRKTYTGDNVSTSFATSPVIFYLTSNLQVRVTVIATGVSTFLTENTHYTVSGGAATGATGTVNLAGGSSPHGALLSTEKLVILRVLPLTQASDFVNNSNSDAEVLEAALDKLTDVDQQIQEQADRSIRFASGDVSGSVTEIPDVTTRAGKLLGFDAVGLLTTIAVMVGTSLVDLAAAGASALIGFIQAGTGALLRTLQSKVRETVSVTDFGADPLGIADSTAAFNAAILASDDVFVPAGTYLLSSLASFRSRNLRLHGCGRASILKFNTAGKGITAGPWVAGNQRYTLSISDLAFTNVTNVPSAFISQEFYVNALFERLYFSDCAATYCIDNVSGYGTQVRGCVFSAVTGGAIRLRDNGAVPNYSYVFGVDDCDITGVTAIGIEIESTTVVKVSKTTIEGCGGKGVSTSTNAARNTQEVFFDTCYFEANTGTDVDLQTDGASYWGRATFIACWFNTTGVVALGSKSKATFIGIQGNGGSHLTVSGSASAEAYFIGCESSNIDQSGSFLWSDPSKTTTYNPTITNVTTSAINGRYQRVGNQIVYKAQVTVSAAPTGVIKVSLPIAASTALPNLTVGAASAICAGVYRLGAAWLFDANTLEFHENTTGNEWAAAAPGAWVNGNSFEFTVTYFT